MWEYANSRLKGPNRPSTRGSKQLGIEPSSEVKYLGGKPRDFVV